jgi:hypothetical protein
MRRIEMAEWDGVERRKDNWTLIVREYVPKIGTRWKDQRGEYTFFGLVHADDDYYYGLMGKDGRMTLVTCVGALESMYEAILPLGRCERCGRPHYADTECMVCGCPLRTEEEQEQSAALWHSQREK